MRAKNRAFAALAVGALAFLLGSAPASAQEISDQAKRHFSAGVALLQDPEGEKVEEAYRQFKTAYDLSASPKILGNMGFCAMRLERDGEAIDYYTRYLREVADIDPEERAQIVRDLQTITVGVTRVSIEVNAPDVTIIDERTPVRGAKVTNTYGPLKGSKIDIGIRSGHHVMIAKANGRQDAVWELEAYAGGKESHAFVLPEVRTSTEGSAPAVVKDDRPSAVGPIILLATGGAMLVGGGITGLIALNKTSDIEEQCPGDRCPPSFDLRGERSSARTFVSVTDLLLLVGTVAVLGGLYWGYRVASASPKTAALPAAPRRTSTFLSDWRLSL